ncbi:hypothetical protein M0813_21408 [Anaeramoeba flamelloides]|uniref:Uncharacterized protein n=1 Tax=Anaeramoeba flamelloides TaxID=1746091 RepID=A0ABQ8YHR4_9EUKA|nr:hypothetical protein M0813_21408 [Anaeramoeba flamelloides]
MLQVEKQPRTEEHETKKVKETQQVERKARGKGKEKAKEKDNCLSIFLRSKKIVRKKGYQYLTKALETLKKPSNTTEILEQIKLLYPMLWKCYLEFFKTEKDAEKSLRIFVVENPINTMKVSRKRWTNKSRPNKIFDFGKHFYFEQSVGSERRNKIGLKKWLKFEQFLKENRDFVNNKITLNYDISQKMIGTSFYNTKKERTILSELLLAKNSLLLEENDSDILSNGIAKNKNKNKNQKKNQKKINANTKRYQNKNKNNNNTTSLNTKTGDIQTYQKDNNLLSVHQENENDDYDYIFDFNNNLCDYSSDNNTNTDTATDKNTLFGDENLFDSKFDEHQLLEDIPLSNRKRFFNLNLKSKNQNVFPYYYQNLNMSVSKDQKRKKLNQKNVFKPNIQKSNQLISEIIENYSENYENVLFELQTQKKSKLKLSEKIIEMKLPQNILSTVLKRIGSGDKIVIMLINKYSKNNPEETDQLINALISYVIKFY